MAFVREIKVGNLVIPGSQQILEGDGLALRSGVDANGEPYILGLRAGRSGEIYGERLYASGRRDFSDQSVSGEVFAQQGGIRRHRWSVFNYTWMPEPQPQTVAVRSH